MKKIVQSSPVDACNNEEIRKASLQKRRNALADIFYGLDAQSIITEKNMKKMVQDSPVDACNNKEIRKASLQKRRNALADIFYGIDAKAVERLFGMSDISETVPEEEILKMQWETISGEERFLICVTNQRDRRNGMGDIFRDVSYADKQKLFRSKDGQDQVGLNANTRDLSNTFRDSQEIYIGKRDNRRSSLPDSVISRPMMCKNVIYILNSVLTKSFEIHDNNVC